MSSWLCLEFKRNKQKCNIHYVAILMMTPQIFKLENFTKTQKPRYFENEISLPQIKKLLLHITD